MVSQAVIELGKKNTDCGTLKDLAPDIEKKSFLSYLVWNLARQGITDIVLIINEEYIGLNRLKAKEFLGTKINVIKALGSEKLLSSLELNKNILQERFWLLSGDAFSDCPYRDIVVEHRLSEEIIVHGTMKDPIGKFEEMYFDSNFYVTPTNNQNNYYKTIYNTGVYLLNKKILNYTNKENLSLDRDKFSYLIKNKKLKLFITESFLAKNETLKCDSPSKKEFFNFICRPALFLDRDGTINIDNGYTHKLSDLELIDGAAKTIKYATSKGFYIVIITNQGGVSLGKFSVKDMHLFNNALVEKFRDSGANVDYVYYCIHHPDAKNERYKHCDCRKPKPGMILKAFDELPIIKEKSIMIGDKDIDVAAANNAGIKGYKFEGTNLLDFISQKKIL